MPVETTRVVVSATTGEPVVKTTPAAAAILCELLLRQPLLNPCSRSLRRSDPPVVHRPELSNAFEFTVLAGLRAAQLARGCMARVPCADKITVTAQLEVAAGKVVRDRTVDPPR
jgi:DNA-directed RNA polymerase subunit K/omega